ncbi:MAG: tripartite tricarboxylate transporter permease [Chloroflexota bacterium]|nr:tripartite tricarboxylate transporter permease [Chloroflexota bacterium]MDE2886459.1 tripartite tricarboxylate transporter permease [Chloroflexota bacterium]
MVNRIPLTIGIVFLAVFVWGYVITVDRAFFDAAADGANRLFGLHDHVSLFGLSIPVSWPMIAFVLMIPIAIISGLMPGGGLPFLVVVLAFATEIDNPFIALPVVIGYMAANDLTEPIPSILLGIPGARSSQATILDGYPLARQGYAGYALGASYTSSLIGGIIGGFALLAVLPFARELLRHFGSAEFFLLALLGICAVAIVSAGAFVKGMLTACLGLFIGMIGFVNIASETRATFGIDYLYDGINIVPVVVGLFAIPEIADLVISNTPVAKERLSEMLKEGNRDVARGMREALRHKWLITRSSLIGVFIGAMPGLGPTPAHWLAYAQARQTEKGAVETFGTGDIRGVIAPESSNNSTDGGVLMPTLIFAIPGSGPMAIVLGFLYIVGVQPGPAMVNPELHLNLTLSLVYVIVLANILVVPIVLRFSPLLTKVAAVPPLVLAPLVLGIVTLAAFQANLDISDLTVMIVFAALGMFMKAYAWPRPPILIAVVLAGPLETFMSRAIQTEGIGMVTRIPFLAILVVVVAAVFFSLRVQRGAQRLQEQTLAKEAAGGAES